jgi:hypothetical protein
MPVPPPDKSIQPGTKSLHSVQQPATYYVQRLQTARSNVERLEGRLQSSRCRGNDDLVEVWQNELAYWRQQERSAAAMVVQLGSKANAPRK